MCPPEKARPVNLLYHRVWPVIHLFLSCSSSTFYPFQPFNTPAFRPLPPALSPTMSTTAPPPPPQPRGVDLSLPTCGELECSSHGKCVVQPGGGAGFVCDCHLGYRGDNCEETVNEALSLPLTLSVVAVIVAVLIIAFVVAKMRQRQKRQRYLETSISVVKKSLFRHDAAC